MIKVIFLLIMVVLSSTLSAADQWNVYQWNKKNSIENNGKVDTAPWFEWWYYKITLPTKESFFFVYGIVNPFDKINQYKATRSYVGAGDFYNKLQVEERFSINQFNASYTDTYVTVKENLATDKYLRGSIKNENNQTISWNISIEKKWAFNAEGWLMGKLVTDIEWYPAAADARCSGSIISSGKLYQFKDAPCYQDRNWGKTFPDWWTWLVSNNFYKNPGTTLAIGGGKPRVYGNRTPISSVAIGLNHQGKIYDFRPNDLNYVKVDATLGNWKISAFDRHYKIEITANAPKDAFLDLQFITPTNDLFHDYETLNGSMNVKLYKYVFGDSFELIADLYTDFAGLEFGSSKIFKTKLSNSFKNNEMVDLLKL